MQFLSFYLSQKKEEKHKQSNFVFFPFECIEIIIFPGKRLLCDGEQWKNMAHIDYRNAVDQ